MKKLILTCCALLLLSKSFSQNPDLYRTWYLTYYTYDLGDTFFVADIQPRISPYITIDEFLGFTGEAACSSYIGEFSYNANQDLLVLDNFDSTLTLCDFQSHNDFENDYFGYFVNSQSYTYEIYTDTATNDSYLTISVAPGFDLVYQDFPLNDLENVAIEFKIFPNPVSETLFISSKIETIEKLAVYSINGSLMFSKTNNPASIDVSLLSNGIYFLEIISEKEKSIRKFIKN
ncbi:MAG: T9SS type A sorting domain-containing protein [Aequorivita sp.]|nr:T9SS type A sorting domain-containing protein [Aequorivita sp.]